MKAGLLNVVVRFKEEGGVKKMDPIYLTKIIRKRIKLEMLQVPINQ